MIANKRLFAFLFALLAASPAYAQNAAAPAMFDVEEVVVQPIHFGDDKVAESCGLSQQELGATITKVLRDNGVPALSATDAKPPVFSRARINLVPDIFSYNSQGLDCTSWISLRAESQATVHIPPVDLARNVTIGYWREGSLLSTAQSTQEGIVLDTLQKMSRHFAAQYKQDQPAPPQNR